MPPVVGLPRGPSLGAKDLIWLVPTAIHLSMVLFRSQFVAAVKPHLSDWSPTSLNHLWGFIVQFANVATWGGDGFNVAGMAARFELGPSRFVRMLLQFAGAIALAHAAYAIMGEEWANQNMRDQLPAIKVCGISDGGKSACEMNYCDIIDGLTGACTVKKAGCCIPPMFVVLDEIRHVFWFPFTMRMLAPYLGWGLLTPLGASVFQLMVRLFPSTMTGSWINPSPHFLRAYMTGDYSYIHLIYAATIGAQLAALAGATLVKYLISLVFPSKGGKAGSAAKAPPKKKVPSKKD